MHWAFHSLRGELPPPWPEILLTCTAVICGAIIGTERERHDKPAGLRTLILVSLGSTVFTMISFAFTSSTGDSGRVAAQIVTGIGFLGAGAILHSRAAVSGMTTAAAIWMMAAIGLTVGAGFPIAGLTLAVLVRVVLAGVRRWEINHLGGLASVAIEVLFDPDRGKSQVRMERIREDFHIPDKFNVEPVPGETMLRARLNLKLPRRHIHDFLGELVNLPAVQQIREIPRFTPSTPIV